MADCRLSGDGYALSVAKSVIGKGIVKAVMGDLGQTVPVIGILDLDGCLCSVDRCFSRDFCQSVHGVIAVIRLMAGYTDIL